MSEYTSNSTLTRIYSIEEIALLEEYPKETWPTWANWLTYCDGYVCFWNQEPAIVNGDHISWVNCRGVFKQHEEPHLGGLGVLKIAR